MTAARAAAEKKASDVVVLDVRELIVITDYFVIASGGTERHVRTISEEVEHALAVKGIKPVRREGLQQGRWALIDFVDIVVHVFTTEERDYYELERLWKDAPRTRWEQSSRSAPRRTKAAPERS
ncbi:MAG: ribosome silencing factor [Actinomycetota bacterium]